jgi:hypothetical protein
LYNTCRSIQNGDVWEITWVERLARMGETRNAHRVSVGKCFGKCSLGRTEMEMKKKIGLGEIGVWKKGGRN